MPRLVHEDTLGALGAISEAWHLTQWQYLHPGIGNVVVKCQLHPTGGLFLPGSETRLETAPPTCRSCIFHYFSGPKISS